MDLLNRQWTEFKTNVRGTAIIFENELLGPLTNVLHFINDLYKAVEAFKDLFPFFVPGYELSFAKGYSSTKHTAPTAPANTNFPLTQGNTAVSNSTVVKIDNINVTAPEGTDPGFFGSSLANELQKHISQVVQYYNGPRVG